MQQTQQTALPISSRYQWLDSNRLKEYESWEEEIAFADSQGYALVPPEYHIPHWSTKMRMGDAMPKIYVMRMTGMLDELTTSFDSPASRLAYPLFFLKGQELPRRFRVKGVCMVPSEVEIEVLAASQEQAIEVAQASDWRKHIGQNGGDSASAYDWQPTAEEIV